MSPSRAWALACRGLGGLGVVAFITLAFTPLVQHLNDRLETHSRLVPAEAIVVLGAGIHPDGTLSGGSFRRAIDGILLVHRGLAPRILFLGAGQSPAGSEADVRTRLARDLAVPAEKILVAPEALTTREEAVRASELLRPLGIRRILLVTSSHHLERARRLFERVGFEVFPVAITDRVPVSEAPEDRLQLARRLLQELLGRAYYRLAGYL